ncbi:MAG: DUF2911 domain-containing protein [Acidobacteria bacterium]|nr:DUF2911 domain-containing protein [Acidobacteriota bacterium]
MKKLLITGLLLAGAFSTFAQEQRKKAPLSPPAETSVTIDGKKITINYSAPSMRGRKIFGGLVPYGKVWRAGANAATALTTQADLQMGNLNVPKGSYTLFVLPEENQFQLIVNKQTGQWGLQYDQSQDLGRIPMEMGKTASPVEKFKITLSDEGGNKGLLKMEWENTVASVPFTVK